MSNRFMTDGAGQEILGNLDAIQKTLAGQSASAASPSDFTGKQFLTEETGRDIASKLASIMESLASYVAPSAKKVQNKLSISVNGELTEYDGSAEETVDLEDGLEGLGIFRSTTSTSTGTTSISISTITVPEGRSLKVGDLIIANSTYSYLYRVTAVNASTVTVTYLQPLRGATGSRGATGTTPNISVSASVSNTTGTPSVTVTEGGTTAAPSFAFAFSGLKGSDADVPAVYEHNIGIYSATKRANAFFKIFNNSNAKMSFSDIVSTLIQRGQESNAEMCVANGIVEYESELKNVCYVFALNSTSIQITYCKSVGNFGGVTITSSDLFSGYPKDRVVKII